MRLILASASPRRRELLDALGYDFNTVPSAVDEESFGGAGPAALARRIARAKAEAVSSRYPDNVVLAADTIVVLRGLVLNKPRDAKEARRMLGLLRGRRHRVITGVCVGRGRRVRVEHTITSVLMRPYSDEEVEASIARGDPFDKAGGYAIQDPLFAPMAAYEGCYCNVVGLPLWPATRLLQEFGVAASRPAGMPQACRACLTKPKSPASGR